MESRSRAARRSRRGASGSSPCGRLERLYSREGHRRRGKGSPHMAGTQRDPASLLVNRGAQDDRQAVDTEKEMQREWDAGLGLEKLIETGSP